MTAGGRRPTGPDAVPAGPVNPGVPPHPGSGWGGPRLSRRGLFGVAALAGVAATGAGGYWVSRPSEPGLLLPSRTPLPVPFLCALPVPEVLTPGRSPDHPDADYYEITQRPARLPILPARMTEVWGFNGTFPGPTIVSRTGRRTVVRHINHLSVPVVTHLHGGHASTLADGFATDLVLPVGMSRDALNAPGMTQMAGTMADPGASICLGTRDFEYPMNQRAATLWYHDHRMSFTGLTVWRGLAGFHLIRDDEEDALPLPRGDREIPLMITDRSFEADG